MGPFLTMEQQRTAEWFDKRRGRLTGSSIGAALGVDPFRTKKDLIRQMVRSYHGYDDGIPDNPALQWGRFHEEGAQFDYEMQTGNKVEECGFFPYDDWLGASPDGLIGEDGVLEIKCPYGKRNDEKPKFKSIWDSDHYYAQIQIEMLATGRYWCHFYQWNPYGDDLETVLYDQAWFDENWQKLADFYQWFMDELDNPVHLQPQRVQDDSSEAGVIISEYQAIKTQIENLKERQAHLLDQLIDRVDGQDALIHGHKLTKVAKKGSISYSKVVKDHLPDLDLEEYRGKPSTSWRLS